MVLFLKFCASCSLLEKGSRGGRAWNYTNLPMSAWITQVLKRRVKLTSKNPGFPDYHDDEWQLQVTTKIHQQWIPVYCRLSLFAWAGLAMQGPLAREAHVSSQHVLRIYSQASCHSISNDNLLYTFPNSESRHLALHHFRSWGSPNDLASRGGHVGAPAFVPEGPRHIDLGHILIKHHQARLDNNPF